MPNRNGRSYDEAQKLCASHGSIITPIKHRGHLKFFKALASQAIGGDMWIGLQETRDRGFLDTTTYDRPMLATEVVHGLHFSDGEEFPDSALAQLEVLRLKGSCFGLKAAVGFEVREMKCSSPVGVICQWIGTDT